MELKLQVRAFIDKHRPNPKHEGARCTAETCECAPWEWGNVDDSMFHAENMRMNELLNELEGLL